MEHFVNLMVSEWYQRSDKKKLSASARFRTRYYSPQPFILKNLEGCIVLYIEVGLE